MTKRLSEDELMKLENYLDPGSEIYSDVFSLIKEIRASRKAAAVVREALENISKANQTDAIPTITLLSNEIENQCVGTLANPDVISWMGGEV